MSVTQDDINRQLTQLTEEYSAYLQAKNRMEPNLANSQTTTTANLRLELELRELKRELQRMNKQYLDASNSRPAAGFHALGLSTFEDWTLAAFFFSLTLFALVLTGYVASLSLMPWRVTLFGLLFTIVILGIAAILLRSLG